MSAALGRLGQARSAAAPPAQAQARHLALGVAVLRITAGLLFVAHLYYKFAVMEGGFGQWWSLLQGAGYPTIVLLYAVSAEIVGAVCLTLGLYTRAAALYTLPFMIGAAQFWAMRKGFFFTSAGAELPVVWCLLLVALAFTGAGALAIDTRRRKASEAPSLPRGALP